MGLERRRLAQADSATKLALADFCAGMPGSPGDGAGVFCRTGPTGVFVVLARVANRSRSGPGLLTSLICPIGIRDDPPFGCREPAESAPDRGLCYACASAAEGMRRLSGIRRDSA